MEQTQEIILKPTKLSDLELFFQFQLDEEANLMAAFTSENPGDKEAYIKNYSKKYPTICKLIHRTTA